MRSYHNKNVECFTTAEVFHDRSMPQQVIAASFSCAKSITEVILGNLIPGGGRIDISCSVVLGCNASLVNTAIAMTSSMVLHVHN